MYIAYAHAHALVLALAYKSNAIFKTYIHLGFNIDSPLHHRSFIERIPLQHLFLLLRLVFSLDFFLKNIYLHYNYSFAFAFIIRSGKSFF